MKFYEAREEPSRKRSTGSRMGPEMLVCGATPGGAEARGLGPGTSCAHLQGGPTASPRVAPFLVSVEVLALVTADLERSPHGRRHSSASGPMSAERPLHTYLFFLGPHYAWHVTNVIFKCLFK